MEIQIQEPRVERGITKLIIPHEKGELISASPSFGPGNYRSVGEGILNDANNLGLQTGYEISLLAKTAYGREEVEFKDVKDKINKSFLWVYKVNFWLPAGIKNSGMYSINDPKALGREMNFNQEELEEKLRGAEVYQGVRINRDNGVAFASRSTIHLGKETDWSKFAINGENIAIFFPEGAENLAELGKKHFKYGYNFGANGNMEVQKAVCALGGDWDFGDWLVVCGDDWVDGGGGHAFGVCKDSQGKQ